MREILFRGKQLDGGKWLEGYLTYRYRYDQQSKKEILAPVIDTPHKFTFGDAAGIVIGSIQVIPGTEGQFTGLTDKNGKKIFEGDIIKAKSSHPCGGDISATVVVNLDDYELMWEIDHSHEIEVIGNIHDNPELLEVSE